MNNINRAIESCQARLSNYQSQMEKNISDGHREKLTRQIEIEEVKISALEKQIPKKVIHNKAHNEYDCPQCKTYIKEDEYFGYPIGEDENHCKICGQALDWGNEDE